jgi:hypothetical protein
MTAASTELWRAIRCSPSFWAIWAEHADNLSEPSRSAEDNDTIITSSGSVCELPPDEVRGIEGVLRGWAIAQLARGTGRSPEAHLVPM